MTTNNDFLKMFNFENEDLNLVIVPKESEEYVKSYNKAEDNEEVQKILQELTSKGFTPNKEETVVRKVDLENSEQNIKVVQVIYSIYNAEKLVGGLIFTEGVDGEAVFATIYDPQTNTNKVYYIEDEQVNHIIVEDDDTNISQSKTADSSNNVTIQDSRCMGVCSGICGAGFGSQIGTCVSQCRLAGPGAFYCTGLCAIIVGSGCFIGCDSICDLFGAG